MTDNTDANKWIADIESAGESMDAISTKTTTAAGERARGARWGVTWGERLRQQAAIDFPDDKAARKRAMREAAQQLRAFSQE